MLKLAMNRNSEPSTAPAWSAASSTSRLTVATSLPALVEAAERGADVAGHLVGPGDSVLHSAGVRHQRGAGRCSVRPRRGRGQCAGGDERVAVDRGADAHTGQPFGRYDRADGQPQRSAVREHVDHVARTGPQRVGEVLVEHRSARPRVGDVESGRRRCAEPRGRRKVQPPQQDPWLGQPAAGRHMLGRGLIAAHGQHTVHRGVGGERGQSPGHLGALHRVHGPHVLVDRAEDLVGGLPDRAVQRVADARLATSNAVPSTAPSTTSADSVGRRATWRSASHRWTGWRATTSTT
jgi:hypothetical protein